MYRLLLHVAGIFGMAIVFGSCDHSLSPSEYVDLTQNQIDVLFVSESSGSQQIYGVQDTTFDQVISVNAYNFKGALDPSWSADGRKFVYTNVVWSTQNGYPYHTNIYIMNMDSISNVYTPVTYSEFIIDTNNFTYGTLNMRPDWSLQTNKIVFISNRDSVFNIYVTGVTDSLTGDSVPIALTELSDKIDVYCYPSFSPDGSKILYTSKKSGNEEIWVMNSDGTNKTQLTHNGAAINSRPRFSPSADRISFFSNRWVNGNDSLQIYTMDPGGANLDTVTTSGNNYDPAWSQDGNEIIYAKRGGTASRPRSYIHMIGRNGLNDRKLIAGDGKAYYPSWRPQP